MGFIKTHNRALIFASVFAAIIIIITLFIYTSMDRWRNEIIRANKSLCIAVVHQLSSYPVSLIDSLGKQNYFNNNSITLAEQNYVDTKLKKYTRKALLDIKGMEGGFYFNNTNKFYGYSYPTSPPPSPAYGPPPRSYNIIEEQVLLTIKKSLSIVKLHQFDPAIFPLATMPLIYNNKVVGAVWVRTHIERELPAIKLQQVVNIAAIISLLGFLIAVLISIRLRSHITGIKIDIEKISVDSSYRLNEGKGIFGYISRSFNNMLNNMQTQNRHRQQLEKELNQKEKMASLGTLIAGVAHEVKTPLAIIKTRIQMWQRYIERNEDSITSNDSVISNNSMQLVVNQIDRLSNLVKRLLVFSQPTNRNFSLVDINKLIIKTISFIETSLQKDKIVFIKELDDRTQPIYANENALEQVLINVITNSIEAIPNKGKLIIRTKQSKKPNGVKIILSDSGVGISNDIIDNIWNPFFTTKKDGVGLGLSISYEIIKTHNGEIMFVKNLDVGSTCIITLPQKQII